MFARVTQLEIDIVRTTSTTRSSTLRQDVLPRLRAQPGYEGVYVLTTTEGKGLIVSFGTREARGGRASRASTPRCSSSFVTLFRAPPGRERYEVRLSTRRALADGADVQDAVRHSPRHFARRSSSSFRWARLRRGPRAPQRRPRCGSPAQCPPSAGPHGAHRRRAHARDDDHRRGARHRRHHQPHDPGDGRRRARRDGRDHRAEG